MKPQATGTSPYDAPPWVEAGRAVAVGCYLGAAYVWLRARGRLRPLITLGHVGKVHVAATVNRALGRAVGRLTAVRHDGGRCYVTRIPLFFSDIDSVSSLVLLEDGRPLGPASTTIDVIRALGRGRYSHWRDHLYFSTSDDTDPRTNGRAYTYRVV